jgi:L-threonylcarbamoyladenylate synthase
VHNYSVAINVLRNDGVIAYPTEAVYGLGCSPFSEKAVEKLLAIKQRDVAKGLILIAANFAQLESLLQPLPQERLDQILATWPGPVSWAWPKTNKVPAYIHGDWSTTVVYTVWRTVGIDQCQSPGCRSLSQCRRSECCFRLFSGSYHRR